MKESRCRSVSNSERLVCTSAIRMTAMRADQCFCRTRAAVHTNRDQIQEAEGTACRIEPGAERGWEGSSGREGGSLLIRVCRQGLGEEAEGT
eukprot:3789570-Prymnesium_polylepis.1